MSLVGLLDGDITEYLQQQADRPGALWLFLHVPKTAGSSFRAELAGRLQPDRNIVVNYEDESTPFHQRLQSVIREFADTVNESAVRFASGHIFRSHAAFIAQYHPDVRPITMLRNPVARIVSDFRYARTPLHPPYRQFIRQFPSFEDYVNSPASQNKIHEFLRRAPSDPPEQVIHDVEQTFSFLGVTEMYYLSCRVLFALLGDARNPTVYERRTEPSEDNEIADLEALTPRIRQLNAKDVAIYEHFHDKLKRRRNDILRALPPST
ncbi:MAG: hypothetical protein ACT4QA_18100 [Panacagrimonas sp.]